MPDPTPALMLVLLGALIGACVGSFIGALVLRWIAGASVARGRSHCDGCGATLRLRDLIPLVSFLALRGRCARCGARIDAVQPVAEAAAASIGGAAFLFAPLVPAMLIALFGWQLLALALTDARALWLPRRLTVTLALSGLALGGIAFAVPLADRLIGGAAGFASLAIIALAYRRVRQRDGMGGGDPWLLGALGCWLGWPALPLLLLFAAVAGLGVAAVRAATGSRDWRTMQLPFGTLLALSVVPVLAVLP